MGIGQWFDCRFSQLHQQDGNRRLRMGRRETERERERQKGENVKGMVAVKTHACMHTLRWAARQETRSSACPKQSSGMPQHSKSGQCSYGTSGWKDAPPRQLVAIQGKSLQGRVGSWVEILHPSSFPCPSRPFLANLPELESWNHRVGGTYKVI